MAEKSWAKPLLHWRPVAARRSGSDVVGLEHRDGRAPLRQGEGRRQDGEAASDDGDVDPTLHRARGAAAAKGRAVSCQ